LPAYKENLYDKTTVAKIKKGLTQNSVAVLNRYMIITGEEKNIIQKEIETKVADMSIQEILLQENYDENASINKYFYKNNRLQGISIPANITDEVLKIASKHTNKAVIEKIKADLTRTHNYQVYNGNENIFEESKTYIYYSEDITKFILANENEFFDVTKPYYVITLDGRDSLQFYTNKIEEIQSIIAKAQEYENSLDRGNYKD